MLTARQVTDAHNALSSITSALKSHEYLGSESRKRLLIHAVTIRRALEACEQIVVERAVSS